MRLALALKVVEVVEERPVYSLLDELLWCGKSETTYLKHDRWIGGKGDYWL